ncbi:MAG: response regulator, partial [Myxococcota bacterium]
MLNILLVDDEPSIRLTVADALLSAGHEVEVASNGQEAMTIMERRTFDLVVTDIRMPKLDGLSLFRQVRQMSPDTDVILMTAYGEVSDAVAALKEGAFDYLTKPFDTDELLMRLERLTAQRKMRRDLDEARRVIAGQDITTNIVGRSPVVVRLLKRLETIARCEASVVVTGESGTGKELVARALHAGSSRRDMPFVTVNCAAFPETLIEAELF